MTIFKFEGISKDYFTTFSRYIQMFKIPKIFLFHFGFLHLRISDG